MMGYRGGKLTSLVDVDLAGEATRRMALRGGEQLTEDAAAATPVDTARTRESWETIEPERVPGGWRSGTVSHSHIALFLDAGVEPHKIEPKRREAVQTEQGPRGAVDHPGFVGRKMTQQAATKLEASMDRTLRPEAEEWAEEQEARAKRRPGVR